LLANFKIKNTKSEYRNPKQILNSNFPTTKRIYFPVTIWSISSKKCLFFCILIIRICFEIRISLLNYLSTRGVLSISSCHSGLDPWFDKLTTLSYVEGESSFFKSCFWMPACAGMTVETPCPLNYLILHNVF